MARYEGIPVLKEVGARKRYIGGIYQRGSKRMGILTQSCILIIFFEINCGNNRYRCDKDKNILSLPYMIAARLSKELKAHKADIDPSAKIIVTVNNKLLRKTLVEIAWEE